MIKTRYNNRKFLLAGVALAAVAPSSAWAEEVAAESSDYSGEIVITATKLNTSLQQASLSATAVSADTLKENNITDVTGLNGSVPSLVVAKSGGGERMVTIRGIGSETPENLNSQPGVSYHIDGVYIFNSIAANAAFVDVGQVEVLRGPQGTTFGQGSTGGTINVVSREPVLGQFGMNGEVGLGNYNLMNAEVGMDVPVGDTLAFRVYGNRRKHDGYAYATDVEGYDKYDLDDENSTSWKAMARWEPTDNLKVTLATIQYDSNTHGAAQKNVLDPSTDPRILTQDYPGRSKVETDLYYGTVALDVGFATVKSITSYQKLHSEQAWDGDGLNAALFKDVTYWVGANPWETGYFNYDHVALWQSDNESWTQEVNLSSNGEGPFKWIVGGVYLWSKNDQYIVEYRAADNNLVRPPLPVDTAWNDPLVSTLTYASLQSATRKAWAAYFQGTYDLTDKLALTAGIRYNHDEYSGTSASSNGDIPATGSGSYLQPTLSPGLSTNEWTGKLALEYRITPENMLYASYTRGFKPGGLNGTSTSYVNFGWDTGIKPTYQPEVVDSFEIGSKNRFFDNALQLNVSAFYYKYKNMQFLDEDAILYGEGTANAPSANIYGIELEANYRITDSLRLETSVSQLNGEFDADYLALDPVDALAAQNAAGYPDWLFWSNYYAASLARESARKNINGNKVPKLPKWQGSAALVYNGEVGPGELTARVQYQYRGEFFYRVFNNEFYDTTPAYSVVNLYAKYEPKGLPVYFSASVSNLFDEAGVNSRFSDPYGSSQGFETYIAPRQAIFSVGFSF
ncbi:MAG: TonB-dependent receptor [Sphingomonadales bacterium 63-6]|nr:MAG: TonB-dependent receptor [Sphingomonadales bacterium 63-6]